MTKEADARRARLGADRVAWFEAIPGRFAICDAQGAIVYVTASALKLFGRTVPELVGRPLSSLIEPERPADPLLPTLVARGSDEPTPAVVLHASGARFHTRLVARLSELDGDSLYVVALNEHPIESLERPPSTEKLGQLYRSLFEQAPVGIFHFDRQTTITACNQAFADVIGSSIRVLVGLDVKTLPDKRMVALTERALAGEVVRVETTYHSITGGQAREVRIVFAPVYEGATVTGGICITLDVTAEKEAKRALERSSAALRDLFETAPDAIAIIVDGRYVQVNSRLAALYGYDSPNDLVGRRVVDLVHPAHRETHLARLARVVDGEQLAPFEYRILRRDGTERLIEVSSIPFEFEGKPSVVAFGRDTTERRELEARLVRADRLASVGTLAAGVGHELNNPLGYVMLTLELLERRIDGCEVAQRNELGALVRRAQEGCERIRSIVRDLATFSRRSEGAKEPLDVTQVVENAVRLVQHTLRHKATLSVKTSDVPHVAGDEARLGQVLVNLLVNAAQAMPEGEASKRHIDVRTESDGETVRIVVADDGPGIPEDALGHVFEPFFTTKPPGEGTGLGLSICHGIVKEHGGNITIASRVGEGTTVTVELPALRREAATAPSADGVVPRAPRSRILVIDDERVFADALREVLSSNHDVSVVYDGPTALVELRRDAAYDLILCDVMMATRDGPNVYADIVREFPELEARVVFMSGGAVTPGVRERLSTLSVALLAKPFGVRDIEALLVERGRRRA